MKKETIPTTTIPTINIPKINENIVKPEKANYRFTPEQIKLLLKGFDRLAIKKAENEEPDPDLLTAVVSLTSRKTTASLNDTFYLDPTIFGENVLGNNALNRVVNINLPEKQISQLQAAKITASYLTLLGLDKAFVQAMNEPRNKTNNELIELAYSKYLHYLAKYLQTQKRLQSL